MRRNPTVIFSTLLVLLSLFGPGCTLAVCTAPELVVTRTDDLAGGLCTEGSCTLRQAILASNLCSGTQTIRIPAGTYALTRTGAGDDRNASGDLDVIDSVHIIGDGMPVIDGNAADRVFDILPGATVDMTGLVVQNGRYVSGGEGGGIKNLGDFTATGVLIRNNVGRSHGNGGGGLYNGREGTALITHSTITANFSDEGAGGILNTGDMTLDNVTISGNDAYGIFTSSGHLEISYSTITNNVSEEIWIAAEPGTVVIGNSIVAGFPESGSCFGATAADFTSNGFNIEYNRPGDDRVCNFDQPSDQAGVDPLLLLLSTYDGAMLPIHALDATSPAIDSADAANCSGTDQRGVARPQGAGCDRGAYESAEGITLPDLPIATAPPELGPPELIEFTLVIQVPANCRQGPGVEYPVVNSALPGEQVPVIGKSADGTWWYSQLEKDKCFISNIAGTPTGDLSLLTVIAAPPTPVPTEVSPQDEPEPTDEGVVDPDNDGDGYPASKDCNDSNGKIHPGAFETPDDKVDSNCNGDDDK